MEELERAILDTWKCLGPAVLRDPAELAKRLARRRTTIMTRPPRAWCLAVRASDTRLTEQTALVTRSHIRDSENHQSIERTHLVQLDAPLLRQLCAPVHIDPPGEECQQVAQKLGVSVHGLWTARFRGLFHTHHVRRLGGKRGKPVPLLYTDRDLDPSARLFARPDPLWVWSAASLTKNIPPRLCQTLTRVATYQPRLAQSPLPPRRKPSMKLPPPQPDHVWYKWSTSGVYLGDDPKFWRKSPRDPGIPPAPGERRRAPWLRPPTPRRDRERHSSSLQFRGWLWVCPACRRKVRTVYCPLPPIDLLINRGPGIPPTPRARMDFDQIDAPIPTFACHQCHRLLFTSRVSPSSWNHLIAQLSAGLLYGHEVPKPTWFTPDRKLPFRPRPMSRPSKRREQVLERMLHGDSFSTIAADLGLRYAVIATYAHEIYRQHQVHSRQEFARATNSPCPARPRPECPTQQKVLSLLLTGHDFSSIAKSLHKTPKAVRLAAHRLYRRHGVHNLAELRARLRATGSTRGRAAPRGIIAI